MNVKITSSKKWLGVLAAAGCMLAWQTPVLAQNAFRTHVVFSQFTPNPAAHVYAISRDGRTAVGSVAEDQFNNICCSFGCYPCYSATPLVARQWNGDGSNSGFSRIGNIGTDLNTEAFAVSGDGISLIAGGGGFGSQTRLIECTPNAPTLPTSFTINDRGVYPGSVATIGLGVSNDGSVVVGRIQYPNGLVQAMRHVAGGPIENLGALIPGAVPSAATDVSADGTVIVGHSDGAIGTKAARYANGVWTSLGALPGGANSAAQGISSDGTRIVGQSEYAGSGINVHPFLYTQAGGMVDLDIPAGFATGFANAVSDNGGVVVGEMRTTISAQGQATVWTPQTGTLHLQNALLAAGYNSLPNYELQNAVDISGDGRRIVGNGSLNGKPIAWFLSDFTLAPIVQAAQTDVWLCATQTDELRTLSASARGLPPMTYAWSRNGIPINPSDQAYTGSNTNSLTINNIALEPTDTTFECTISNVLGNDVQSFRVRRTQPVIITGHPETISHCATTSLIGQFTLQYQSDQPPTTVWQVYRQSGGWVDLVYAQPQLFSCNGYVQQTLSAPNLTHILFQPCPDGSTEPGVTGYPIRCRVTNACGSVYSNEGGFALSTPLQQTVAMPAYNCRQAAYEFAQVGLSGIGQRTYGWAWSNDRVPLSVPNIPVVNGLNTEPSGEVAFIASGADTGVLTITNLRSNPAAPVGRISVKIQPTTQNGCGPIVGGGLIGTINFCLADFNCAQGVSVEDIFQFLASWFAMDPRADFNAVNGVTVQDIFDFLAAWFAGC